MPRRYRIEYGNRAVDDLEALPSKIRQQVLRKIDRLQNGLHGDIKRLRQTDSAYRLRMGNHRICLMWKITSSSFVASETAKTSMTKALQQEVARTVSAKRQQLVAIREEIEDLLDYLDVVESRASDVRKPRLTHEEAKRRFVE